MVQVQARSSGVQISNGVRPTAVPVRTARVELSRRLLSGGDRAGKKQQGGSGVPNQEVHHPRGLTAEETQVANKWIRPTTALSTIKPARCG